MDPAKIAEVKITAAIGGEETTFGHLWADKSCVIIFLRRFGWPFCRLAAKEISLLLPQLTEADIRLVGIGLEPLGLQEFLDGNFFVGELYVDNNKESYKQLGFKKISLLSMVPALVSKKWRDANAKAKAANLGGNLAGDGYQNGGVMVVGKGGTPTIFTYVQEDAADHANNDDIIAALGIK